MIRIKRIAVEGNSDQGQFGGSISLDGRSVIISGHNGLGKTLVSTSVAWCLGVEPLFGGNRSREQIFSEAARHRVRLGAIEEARVTFSKAILELIRTDGSELTLVRTITGGNSNLVTVYFDDGKEKVVRKLDVNHHTMADPTGGFHAFLYQWASLPQVPIQTRSGRKQPIYLENLAALFFIEQLNGWTNIQSNQIKRYGQLDVEAASVEYLLSQKARLEYRLHSQAAQLTEQELRRNAKVVEAKLNEVLLSMSCEELFSLPVQIGSISKKFSDLNVREYVDSKLSVTLQSERDMLHKKIDELQSELDGKKTQASDLPRIPDSSQLVVNLKQEIHALQSELSSGTRRRSTLVGALKQVESELKAASDLLRLKDANIGLPTVTNCPTCNQPLKPDSLSLKALDSVEVETNIRSLTIERSAVRKSVDSLSSELSVIHQRLAAKSAELLDRQRELRLMTRATGPTSESAVAAVTKMLRLERRLGVLDRALFSLVEIQKMVDTWNTKYVAHKFSLEDTSSPAEISRYNRFVRRVEDNLRDLGHGAFRDIGHHEITLDEDYRPLLNGRLVSNMGSASDRARLVFAYALALHQTAVKHRGWHPGFLYLDEPLQQNPDERHRSNFVEMLSRVWSGLKPQVILVTFLKDDELSKLQASNVPVKVLPNAQFLQAWNAGPERFGTLATSWDRT